MSRAVVTIVGSGRPLAFLNTVERMPSARALSVMRRAKASSEPAIHLPLPVISPARAGPAVMLIIATAPITTVANAVTADVPVIEVVPGEDGSVMPRAVTEAARLVLHHYVAEGQRARMRYALTRSVPTSCSSALPTASMASASPAT